MRVSEIKENDTIIAMQKDSKDFDSYIKKLFELDVLVDLCKNIKKLKLSGVTSQEVRTLKDYKLHLVKVIYKELKFYSKNVHIFLNNYSFDIKIPDSIASLMKKISHKFQLTQVSSQENSKISLLIPNEKQKNEESEEEQIISGKKQDIFALNIR